ncbi:MAG: DUF4255 domain-containing protein [Actinobacteria bacterium]|nr:MAG: DUF4255 domain-containing protein [Actinomycetota bacterium]
MGQQAQERLVERVLYDLALVHLAGCNDRHLEQVSRRRPRDADLGALPAHELAARLAHGAAGRGHLALQHDDLVLGDGHQKVLRQAACADLLALAQQDPDERSGVAGDHAGGVARRPREQRRVHDRLGDLRLRRVAPFLQSVGRLLHLRHRPLREHRGQCLHQRSSLWVREESARASAHRPWWRAAESAAENRQPGGHATVTRSSRARSDNRGRGECRRHLRRLRDPRGAADGGSQHARQSAADGAAARPGDRRAHRSADGHPVPLPAAQDQSVRNRPRPTRVVNGNVVTTRAPLGLALHYMISAWGGDRHTEQRMLGRVMQVLYDDAVLDGAELLGVLAGTPAILNVSLQPLNLDDRARVWWAIGQTYRLSVNYEVRVANLDAEIEQSTLPVRERNIEAGVVA